MKSNGVMVLCMLVAMVVGMCQGQLVVQLDKSSSNSHSVVVTMVNKGTEELQVLPWGSPLEERLHYDIFQLEDEAGNRCEWQGAVYRRGPFPAAAHYFVPLAAGEVRSVEYDLASLYVCPVVNSSYQVRLSLPGYALTGPDPLINANYPGHRVLTFPALHHHLDGGDNGENDNENENENEAPQQRQSQVVVNWQVGLNERPKPLSAEAIEEVVVSSRVSTLANSFTNCNAQEKIDVNNAVPKAITDARSAYNCMTKGSGTCSAAATWFGSYSATNWNYDQADFLNIYNRLNNNGLDAYCNPSGCSAGVYAYVYPTRCCTVYLCSVFWSIPAERAETIVHEQSHFNANANNNQGTQDYAYGRGNCQNLAKSNPTQASHNADNLCYFGTAVSGKY